MSALASYFARLGKQVAGYDSTPSAITKMLLSEGILVNHHDAIEVIPLEFINNQDDTLVVYTPAIPLSSIQLNFFTARQAPIYKRAQILGFIANEYTTAAVSGTHGKTTTTTLLTHLLSQTPQGCDAFLGGISKNFSSNLVLNDRGANRMVVEADEFDRSFHCLTPQLAIVTSVDADHLDVYGSHHEVKLAFNKFIENISEGGILIIKKNIEGVGCENQNISKYTYAAFEEADFYAINVSQSSGFYSFDLITPFGCIVDLSLGIPGQYNLENAVAASAAALVWGIEVDALREGLKSFMGIQRRFDIRFQGKSVVYIDDYAHHPKEIDAAISSVRDIYPSRRLTGVFQPHLYTRTQDFMDDFARSLSALDEVILLDIYPAREEPIPGVTSESLLEKVSCENKTVCKLDELVGILASQTIDVLLTMGAGSIDRAAIEIESLLKERESQC